MSSWMISVTTSCGLASRNAVTSARPSTSGCAPNAQWMWQRNAPGRPSRVVTTWSSSDSARAGGSAGSASLGDVDELLRRLERWPVVGVDQQGPHAGVELLGQAAVVLGPHRHHVGRRHRVVGRRVRHVVVAHGRTARRARCRPARSRGRVPTTALNATSATAPTPATAMRRAVTVCTARASASPATRASADERQHRAAPPDHRGDLVADRGGHVGHECGGRRRQAPTTGCRPHRRRPAARRRRRDR